MRDSTAFAARWAVVILAILASAASVGLAVPAVAKEFDLVGSVDCGLREGQRCSVEDQLAVRTEALSGQLERVNVDVSWVRQDLPALDQGDTICLTVETRPNGVLQAVGLIEPCEVEGTANRGLSTGSRDVAERGRRPGDNDDDEMNQAAVELTATPAPTGTSVATATPAPIATPAPTATPGPTSTPASTVTVVGVVRNAVTGAPIAGATVRGPNGVAATADQNGRFSLAGVPTGRQAIEVSAPGFITNARTVNVVGGQNPELSVALVPTALAGDVTITLTWGPQPPDLDARLSGPVPGGGRFFAFFAAPRPVPYAELTRDATEGFGPETIIIRRDPTTGQFVPGEYRFSVNNFSETPEFDVSAAHVDVTQGGRDVGSFDVADATGDPRLDIWHVVNLQIDAAGNVTLVPVQRFVPGDELTVFEGPGRGAKQKK